MSFKFEGYLDSQEPEEGFKFEGYKEQPSRGRSLASAYPKGLVKGAEALGATNPLPLKGPVSSELGHRILEQFLPTQEKLPEQLLERAGKLTPFAVGGAGSVINKLLQLAAGTAGGQLAEEAGAGELGQTAAEIGGMAIPGAIRSIGRKIAASIPESPNLYPARTKNVPKITHGEPVTIDITPEKPIPRKLAGRVSVGGKEIELKPSSEHFIETPTEEAGRAISPQKFYNTTSGGRAVKGEIMDLDKSAYKQVGENYQESRRLNAGIEDIHPELVTKLDERLATLKEIPEPSGPQKDLIRSLENITSRLAVKDPMGGISGYQPISNQTLIDQVQSLRQKIDYDFAHGDTRNIFKPIIEDLQNSVIRAAQNSPEALQAFNKARQSYKNWAEEFDNDYVRPFRDRTNKNYSKLYKSAQDIDEFNMLRSVLDKSKQGNKIQRAVLRDLVENKLKPLLGDLKKFDKRDLEQILRELEGAVSEKESEDIRRQIAKILKRSQRVITPIKREFTIKDFKDFLHVITDLAIGRGDSAANKLVSKLTHGDNAKKLSEFFKRLPQKQTFSEEDMNKIVKKALGYLA
jgi:hypothetical protein